MSVLITFTLGILGIFLSKYLFKKWFNHLAIYTISWMSFIILYEIRLISYVSISGLAWCILVMTYMSFFLGIITVICARNYFDKNIDAFADKGIDKFKLLEDGGITLRNVILLFSIIGLFSAIQHWMVLIDKFGSIAAVIIRANLIYRMRVEGELTGTIPYLYIFSYAGVFLSGLYTAYKNKLTLVAVLPVIAVILKDLATVGRAGIFLGLLEYIISLFLFKHVLSSAKRKNVTKNNKNIIIGFAIICILAVASSTAVKTFRGATEDFKASGSQLNKLRKSTIITPSIYLYFSSNIGVFSQYLEYQDEKAMFGENTFLPIYNFMSKFKIVKHPEFYPRGYFVPMWSNSATYLRELHADFGVAGLFIVPYLLGVFSTFYWYRFYEKKKISSFIILVYLYLIVSFSVFYMITRSAVWILSMLILLFVLPGIEKYIDMKKNAQRMVAADINS